MNPLNWNNGQLPQDSDHIVNIPAGLTCILNGTVDNISTTTVAGTFTIDNSQGTSSFDTSSLTTASGSTLSISSSSKLEVASTATIAGSATVAGTLEGDAGMPGANITLSGTGSAVTSGGLIDAGVGSTVTFASGSGWTLGLGSNLHGGTYNVNGTLTVNGNIGYSDLELNLNHDGSSTYGALTGTGSFSDDADFTWNGGTIGLSGGINDGGGKFEATGSGAKTLASSSLTLTNGYDELGGTGTITLTGGSTITNNTGGASPSLTLSTSLAGGELINNSTLLLDPSAGPITMGSTYLSGSMSGVLSTLEIESGKGTNPVTLTGGGTLAGTLTLNGGSLKLSTSSAPVTYTVTGNLDTEWSSGDLITLGASYYYPTLTIDSGVSADFDHFAFTSGTITGAGDFSINNDGFHSDDSMSWTGGTMTGTGTTTIGGTYSNGQALGATVTINGATLDSRTLDNKGIINITGGFSVPGHGLTLTDSLKAGGPFISNDTDAQLNVGGLLNGYSNGTSVGVLTNDGIVDLLAGAQPRIKTFTQNSDGTIQIHLAAYPASETELIVQGAAALAGEMDVILDNGYQLSSGSTTTLLSAGSVSGTFATTSLPSGASLQYTSSAVNLHQS